MRHALPVLLCLAFFAGGCKAPAKEDPVLLADRHAAAAQGTADQATKLGYHALNQAEIAQNNTRALKAGHDALSVRLDAAEARLAKISADRPRAKVAAKTRKPAVRKRTQGNQKAS